MRQDLINGTYKIQPYYIFYIHTPKKRQIVSTRLRDRIWQRSMCNNGLYDDLTRGFIHDNCACQTGRGTHYAMARLECHMQRIWRKHGPAVWVAKLDISKFFPSIPHIVAKAAAAKRIRDEHFRQHVFDIIDSFKDERPQAEIDAYPFGPRGIALGSQISQLVALAVLDDIDHYIKERLHIRHYVRYMDDLVLIHEDKGVLMCEVELPQGAALQRTGNAMLAFNDKVLKTVKGLGAKTSQRIIVELKDKVASLGITPVTVEPGDQTANQVNQQVYNDACEALKALGYSPGTTARIHSFSY